MYIFKVLYFKNFAKKSYRVGTNLKSEPLNFPLALIEVKLL